MNPRRWDYAQVLAMAQTMKYGEIAKKLGVSETHAGYMVRTAAKEAGVLTPRAARPKKAHKAKPAAKKRNHGVTSAEAIAEWRERKRWELQTVTAAHAAKERAV